MDRPFWNNVPSPDECEEFPNGVLLAADAMSDLVNTEFAAFAEHAQTTLNARMYGVDKERDLEMSDRRIQARICKVEALVDHLKKFIRRSKVAARVARRGSDEEERMKNYVNNSMYAAIQIANLNCEQHSGKSMREEIQAIISMFGDKYDS